MAFFDEIGKKITQTGQKAVQKTKDIADITKLNANVSDEEKKIYNLYNQIGQLYVSVHGDNPETDFETLVSQLKLSIEKTDTLKKQIQDIKGVIRCASCGAEIPNNAVFCSSCGTSVVQQEKVNLSNLITCSSCGKMVEKGMNFCTFCGSPMPASVEPANQTCTSCGAELNGDAAFCVNCGAAVQKNNGSMDFATDSVDTPDNQEIDTPENAKRTCPNCGVVLEKDSVFCTECGTKVD